MAETRGDALMIPHILLTGAGFSYNIGRLAAAFGTVYFGSFGHAGDYRLALYYSAFLFIPAAAFALLLPELPRVRGEVEPLELSASGLKLAAQVRGDA